ncbi:predicted protein [Botrytis cinerea T4]|uniref:Uncharacterized protein n=1 Tax=Botryotinia fuckeliana (strain T4) TaxID=999810 RepID=G2Y1M9_BOTF4|nr:predicted protein [Botrytis cinerea T4]
MLLNYGWPDNFHEEEFKAALVPWKEMKDEAEGADMEAEDARIKEAAKDWRYLAQSIGIGQTTGVNRKQTFGPQNRDHTSAACAQEGNSSPRDSTIRDIMQLLIMYCLSLVQDILARKSLM